MSINNTLNQGLVPLSTTNTRSVPLTISPGQTLGPGIPAGYAGVSSTQGGGTGTLQQSSAPRSTSITAPSTSTGSLGSYKGVSITPGDQASIQAQMAKIDGMGQIVSPTTNFDSTALQPQPEPFTGGTRGVLSFPGLVGNLSSFSNQPTPEYLAAQKQYQTANEQLAELKKSAANNQFIGAGTNMAEYAGTQGLLANRIANQENALAAEMAAAQAAAGIATGQQQTQQQGLGAAAGLSIPQPGQSPTTQYFDPLTGQYSPLAANSAGQGGIGVAGQVIGNLNSSTNFYQSLLPAYNQAQSVASGLNDFLKKNPNINPSSLNVANFANQWLHNQFSNPQYQQLGQYLSELLQTLTPIVGSQGVSNYKTQLVQSMVDPTASAGSIQQQVQNLLSIAQGKLNETYNTFSGKSGFTPGQSQGGSTSGYTFGSFF